MPSTLSGEATLPYLLVCRRVQQELFLSLRLMLAQWRGIMQCLQRFYLLPYCTQNGQWSFCHSECNRVKEQPAFWKGFFIQGSKQEVMFVFCLNQRRSKTGTGEGWAPYFIMVWLRAPVLRGCKKLLPEPLYTENWIYQNIAGIFRQKCFKFVNRSDCF